jgi:uncharacterized protein YcbX
MGTVLGTIERIWRYPIKSTGGEMVIEAAADPGGLVGDRLYAVRDPEGKSVAAPGSATPCVYGSNAPTSEV